MDHLSSSSSSTATTTYTQQSVSNFHQDVPKQTYTTAGTIYKPNNSQPLQPPVRRGRTLKWPPPGGPASELSLFPKSVIAGLPLKGQTHCTTPTSPLPSQIPQYSPLQQNYDRAVSPFTDHSRDSVNDLDIRSLSASRMSSLNMTNKQHSPVNIVMPTTVADKHVDANSTDDEDDETPGENTLRGLTVKSLHNLASYPNPNQKRAQRALLRARPGVNAALLNGASGSRSATPDFGAIPPCGPLSVLGAPRLEASDMATDGSHSPGLFHSAKTDPTTILKLQAEVRPIRDLAGPSQAGLNGISPPPGLFNSHNVPKGAQVGTYKSPLASGPGAPLPLTAGPPGQRQYRASTFESTMKALSGGPDADVSGENLLAADFPSSTPGLTMTNDAFTDSRSSTPDHLKASLSALLATSTPDTDSFINHFESNKPYAIPIGAMYHAMQRGRVKREYKTPEEVRKYYPNGFPAFGVWGRENDTEKTYATRGRPAWKPGTCWIDDKELEKRNERTSRLFYAGTGELGRSLDSVIRDAEFRQFKRQVGVIGDRRPKAKPEKVEYPSISIHEAKHMTDKEISEPFVTMAFSSLLNHAEGGIKNEPFHQWKNPKKYCVDDSQEGRRSVFGKGFEED